MKRKVKIFHLPIAIRIFSGVFRTFLVLAAIALIVGFLKEPSSLAFMACFVIPSLGVFFYLNLFQPIAVTETHLRVYNFWGFYKAVPWENITGIHKPKLAGFPKFFRRDNTLIVKGKNIGFGYKFYGLVYDGGGEGFLIHPKIVENKEFYSELQGHYLMSR